MVRRDLRQVHVAEVGVWAVAVVPSPIPPNCGGWGHHFGLLVRWNLAASALLVSVITGTGFHGHGQRFCVLLYLESYGAHRIPRIVANSGWRLGGGCVFLACTNLVAVISIT
jgi:hypothetical protein